MVLTDLAVFPHFQSKQNAQNLLEQFGAHRFSCFNAFSVQIKCQLFYAFTVQNKMPKCLLEQSGAHRYTLGRFLNWC